MTLQFLVYICAIPSYTLPVMACITISGFPCSGKTTRAVELMHYLEERIASPAYEGEKPRVVIISDQVLNVPRSSYDGMLDERLSPHRSRGLNASQPDSKSEKPARGTLFTAVNRNLSSDTILIIDAMNYIKGFRYQIYCAAREAGVKTCTVRQQPARQVKAANS